MIYETRLVSEEDIVLIVKTLIANGFSLEEIPAHLARFAPFDADILVETLRQFAKAA